MKSYHLRILEISTKVDAFSRIEGFIKQGGLQNENDTILKEIVSYFLRAGGRNYF